MDKYEQHELLGHGTSSVYRATRHADGFEVALKRVKGWAALTPAQQAVALREVAILRAVEHPHVLTLLDTFSDAGDLCLVMGLLRPGARVFADAALPLAPAAVARAGYQLASALAHLHGQAPPLLHRDIKPANLLLAAAAGEPLPPLGPLTPGQASDLVCSGRLVLGDFGSAMAMRRTLATGTVSGTPAYKASEILREDEYAAPADVWACGATLLQLATGHVAGGTSTARKTLMGHGAAQWTLHKALAGTYHDKFEGAEDEAEWGKACAAQRAAWDALGAPLRSLIEACLVLEPGGRAKASELLAHAAFERERRAALVAEAVGKLQAGCSSSDGGGPSAQLAVLTRKELLAVLEAGAARGGGGLPSGIFERACVLVASALPGADEAWKAAAGAPLQAALDGGDADRAVAAARALALLQGGAGGAGLALSALSAVVMVGEGLQELRDEVAELKAEVQRLKAAAPMPVAPDAPVAAAPVPVVPDAPVVPEPRPYSKTEYCNICGRANRPHSGCGYEGRSPSVSWR